MRIITLCCILLLAAGCTKKLKKIDIIIEPGKKVEQVKQEGVKFPVKLAGEPEPVKTSLEPITVYFDFDSDKIRPAEENILNEAAAAFKGKKLDIRGYACPIGRDIYNLNLSTRRAQAVARFFDFDCDKTVRGYGETNLVTRDPAQYYKNRRVVVAVIQ